MPTVRLPSKVLKVENARCRLCVQTKLLVTVLPVVNVSSNVLVTENDG